MLRSWSSPVTVVTSSSRVQFRAYIYLSISIIRVDSEHIFGETKHQLPVPLVRRSLNMVNQAGYAPLNSLAGHDGEIVTSGWRFCPHPVTLEESIGFAHTIRA